MNQKKTKILLRAPNWLGDNILTMPAVFALREVFPNAHIAVMIKKSMADVWEMTPVNEILPFNFRKGIRGLKDRWNYAKILKSKNFDTVVIFPNSFDSALVPFLAKITERIGWATDGRSFMLTKAIPKTDSLKEKQQFLQYIYLIEKWLGEKINADENIRLSIPSEVENKIPASISEKKIVGLNPGSTYGSAKRWLSDNYAELAIKLENEKNVEIIIFGGPGDREICNEIFEKIIQKESSTKQCCKNLAGKTSIVELAAWLKKCACLVTNDTGAMHIAAAVGTPVAAIFGPTDWSSTPPLGNDHKLIKTKVECAPCMKRECPTDHSCMTSISVEEVYEAVANVI